MTCSLKNTSALTTPRCLLGIIFWKDYSVFLEYWSNTENGPLWFVRCFYNFNQQRREKAKQRKNIYERQQNDKQLISLICQCFFSFTPVCHREFAVNVIWCLTASPTPCQSRQPVCYLLPHATKQSGEPGPPCDSSPILITNSFGFPVYHNRVEIKFLQTL